MYVTMYLIFLLISEKLRPMSDQVTSTTTITQGCIMLSGIWFYSPPPAFDFLPRDTLRRVTKSLFFLTLKAIKQYILGFNSVKLCCSNYILPFGTAKSVKSSKIFFFLFFKLLIFFPISKPFDFIPPPPPGGGNTQHYTRLQCD